MTYSIEYSRPAEDDITNAALWWSEHRSTAEAMKWLDEIESKISSLCEHPERFPIAPESNLCPTGLRQMLFGAGRSVTHRVVFTIDGENVKVVRVRHVAQNSLSVDDLL